MKDIYNVILKSEMQTIMFLDLLRLNHQCLSPPIEIYKAKKM